jgi:hypothetical protein
MRTLFACLAVLLAFSAADAQTPGAIGPPQPDFAICAERAGWESSGAYIRDTARCAYAASIRSDDHKRIALIEDIYLKSWSYTIMNKLCFWLSVLLAILVLVWPALGAILTRRPADPQADPPSPGWVQRAVAASSVQTSITALAALSFTFYAHYKDNQRTSEHLMRTLLYAEAVDRALIEATVNAVREMDKGYSFSPAGNPQDGV